MENVGPKRFMTKVDHVDIILVVVTKIYQERAVTLRPDGTLLE
jgi:hypothetical protein